MNAEVRAQLAVAERVARSDGDLANARVVGAGRLATSHGLLRVATRCYRSALELDLFDRDAVTELVAIDERRRADWREYLRAIERLAWPRFGCHDATITLHDRGALVRCPTVGPVLEAIMSEGDELVVHPIERFAGMPLAMALVILRRALWPGPPSRSLARVRVTVGQRRAVWLDETGDWKDAAGARR